MTTCGREGCRPARACSISTTSTAPPADRSSKDRLWWFGSVRHQETFVQIPNTFKDDGSPGVDDAWINSYVVRGTWQATPRNKFAVTYQRNYKWKIHEIVGGGQEGLPIFPRTDGRVSRTGPLLHRPDQVDVADHEPAPDGSRLLG